MTDGGYSLELVMLEPGDHAILVALLDEYLGELAGHREAAVGATAASEYRYLVWDNPDCPV